MEKRGTWASRSTFILAAIGSAVGLGNAWRFPGLAAKHGGGAFMLAYVLALVVIGVPLLMMEIAIGRRLRQGAPGSMRGLNKKLEPIGWAATANAFVINIYYAVVFAWVIMMAIFSYKFAGITGKVTANEEAAGLWAKLIQTTGTTKGYSNMSSVVVVCLLIAWGFIYVCIRNGAHSVGKVVKYTVFLPVICLVIMAVKGFTMKGAGKGLATLMIPKWSALLNAELWIDAVGQMFYSLSIMMAIMFAYGSFLKNDAIIAVDGLIIAFSDFFISFLSSVVLFTTMYGVGMTVDDMSASGVATAFIIYPTAIVNLSSNGIINAIFAFVFYFCLCTLAIDSAFSITEGVSTAISDKFHLRKKQTTITVCLIAGLLSLWFTTGAGLAWLDVVDNWCNAYNLIIVGLLEAIAVGWCFKTTKVLDEINLNSKKFKMAKWWFVGSIKFIAPVVLCVFFVWNLITLFVGGGIYGAKDNYSLASNIIGGWLISALVFASGFIIKAIVRAKSKNGFVEDEISWDGEHAEPVED